MKKGSGRNREGADLEDMKLKVVIAIQTDEIIQGYRAAIYTLCSSAINIGITVEDGSIRHFYSDLRQEKINELKEKIIERMQEITDYYGLPYKVIDYGGIPY